MKHLFLAMVLLAAAASTAAAGYFENVVNGESQYSETQTNKITATAHNLTSSSIGSSISNAAKEVANTAQDAAQSDYPIIETGDLQVMYWDKYVKVVDDHGSGLPADIGIWRAQNIPEGWYMLGDAVVGTGKGGNYPAPDFPILLVKGENVAEPAGRTLALPYGGPVASPTLFGSSEKNVEPAGSRFVGPGGTLNIDLNLPKLAKPLGFELKNSLAHLNKMYHPLNLWKAIAPAGYICLGLVGSSTDTSPNDVLEDYRCVRRDLVVTKKDMFESIAIWKKDNPGGFNVYMSVASAAYEKMTQNTADKGVIFSNVITDAVITKVLTVPIFGHNSRFLVWEGLPAEIRSDTPAQIAQQLKHNYSGTMINSFADKMSQAVAKAVEQNNLASAVDSESQDFDKGKTRPTYNSFLNTYSSASYPAEDTLDSGRSSGSADSQAVEPEHFSSINNHDDLLKVFDLDKISYSSPRFQQGTIQMDKGGYPEKYSIAKITLTNVPLPGKLTQYLAGDDRFKLGQFIDIKKNYTGDILLLARNYSGKETAYAVVLPIMTPAIASVSQTFKDYQSLISGLIVTPKPAAIALGVVGWAGQIKNKKIPGLEADFIWKLKDIPEPFRAPFQNIAGTSATDSFNPAFVFHHGASVLLNVNSNDIPAIKQVGKVLEKSPPSLVFSLLPRGSQVDNYDLKIVAIPDCDIDRSALFPGIDKRPENFTFTTPRVEAKTTENKALGSVKSWFSFSISGEQRLKAYSVITVPLSVNVDTGIEFAGFVDGTVEHPYGLVNQKKFPDIRLVNPQLGGKLGTSGWIIWMGGQPLFNGNPINKISFIRGGVTPAPPFVSFVDLELEKTSLSNLGGPLSKGTITAVGDVTKFQPFPTDMLKLGPFTWKNDIATRGPRLIFSEVTLDTIGITKGVTAMGSLSFDAGDSHAELELGQFQFVYQAAGTIAGRGRTKSLHLGALAFTGRDAADPLLDVYLNNSGNEIDNHILFEGAFTLAGKKSVAYIRINSKDDVAINLTNDSLGLGKLELAAKGSLLSLVDTDKGNALVFSATVKDHNYTDQLSRGVTSSAEKIPIVKQALTLVGGHLFDFESLAVETSPEALKNSQMTKVILKASAFGKSFTVAISQPTACSQIRQKLIDAATKAIEKIAADLIPDPYKFFDDLADDAKNRTKQELDNFKNLAGSRSPKEFADNAKGIVDDHAKQAADAANKAANVAKDTAKKAAAAAKEVAKSIYNSISGFFKSIF